MRRIGFIIKSLTEGGSERNTINLASFLNERGYIIDIICLKNLNSFKKEEQKKLKGFNIIYVTNLSYFPRILLPFLLFYILVRLYSILKKNKYDFLIAEILFFTYYLTSLFSKLLGIKTIFIVANTLSYIFKFVNISFLKIHFLLHKIVLMRADIVVCISKGVRKDLEGYFHFSKNRLMVLYDGIDIQHVRLLSHKKINSKFINILASANYIVSFGRLDERKNISSLLYVFKQILKTSPDLKLVIIGRGEEKEKLESLVTNLNIKNNIIFLGFLDNPYPYIKFAKAFIFTSHYEGFGLTIIEAMACGVPIISVDCPHGPREILEGDITNKSIPLSKPFEAKYGILTPQLNSKKNIKLMANQIINLLNNKEKIKYYRSMSLLRSKHFTLEKMGRKYDDIIKSFYT